MTNYLDSVQKVFFQSSDLELKDLQNSIDVMMGHQIDFAELFFQSTFHESWIIESGIVKDASFSRDKGVGVRALSEEKTGFAYSEELDKYNLLRSAEAAASIASRGQDRQIKIGKAVQAVPLYVNENPLESLTDSQKISLLQKVDKLARNKDVRIKEVIASVSAVYDQIMVVASDGTLAGDIRPLVRIGLTVIMTSNGRTERGSAGLGGRYTYSNFDDAVLEDLVCKAVDQASINMEAIDAPAGMMPVILGNGWPGVLLHEAVGHGLEGDFNRKGTSAFSNKIGQKVASDICTIVDDGTLSSRRGSLTIDDEGTLSNTTVLIEKGILKGYMQDKKNARLMNTSTTGNGRRESYACLPLPRMTNTYMLSGDHEPDEIIKSVKKGIYAPNFGGGQVDITSGKFVFSTTEAYLIENGEIKSPVKGATLIGSGPEVLHKVSMVGNDMSIDPGVGICGKAGQSVPVGVGQPTLKVDEMIVGGTS